jgi:hypothetical protein
MGEAMASPPIPPSFEPLVTRPFSFYPPIVGIEHNEWLFRKATWSEILVVNCKSASEIWIPRRFLGEVSRVEDPVLILGLNRELEYKAGTVWPYQRRILQMPVAVNAPPPPGAPDGPVERPLPAPVVGIRLERSDKFVLKLIGVAVAAFIALYVLIVNFNRIQDMRQRTVTFTTADQSFLELTSRDDATAIKVKLGEPASDRSREIGGIEYRALTYPERKYTVILMGDDQRTAHYIGVMDDHWKPLHSIEMRAGGTTLALLRNLGRF